MVLICRVAAGVGAGFADPHGGRQLRLLQRHGSPTVTLEAGMGVYLTK
jgi:hypothetical protein